MNDLEIRRESGKTFNGKSSASLITWKQFPASASTGSNVKTFQVRSTGETTRRIDLFSRHAFSPLRHLEIWKIDFNRVSRISIRFKITITMPFILQIDEKFCSFILLLISHSVKKLLLISRSVKKLSTNNSSIVQI